MSICENLRQTPTLSYQWPTQSRADKEILLRTTSRNKSRQTSSPSALAGDWHTLPDGWALNPTAPPPRMERVTHLLCNSSQECGWTVGCRHHRCPQPGSPLSLFSQGPGELPHPRILAFPTDASPSKDRCAAPDAPAPSRGPPSRSFLANPGSSGGLEGSGVGP